MSGVSPTARSAGAQVPVPFTVEPADKDMKLAKAREIIAGTQTTYSQAMNKTYMFQADDSTATKVGKVALWFFSILTAGVVAAGTAIVVAVMNNNSNAAKAKVMKDLPQSLASTLDERHKHEFLIEETDAETRNAGASLTGQRARGVVIANPPTVEEKNAAKAYRTAITKYAKLIMEGLTREAATDKDARSAVVAELKEVKTKAAEHPQDTYLATRDLYRLLAMRLGADYFNSNIDDLSRDNVATYFKAIAEDADLYSTRPDVVGKVNDATIDQMVTEFFANIKAQKPGFEGIHTKLQAGIDEARQAATDATRVSTLGQEFSDQVAGLTSHVTRLSEELHELISERAEVHEKLLQVEGELRALGGTNLGSLIFLNAQKDRATAAEQLKANRRILTGVTQEVQAKFDEYVAHSEQYAEKQTEMNTKATELDAAKTKLSAYQNPAKSVADAIVARVDAKAKAIEQMRTLQSHLGVAQDPEYSAADKAAEDQEMFRAFKERFVRSGVIDMTLNVVEGELANAEAAIKRAACPLDAEDLNYAAATAEKDDAIEVQREAAHAIRQFVWNSFDAATRGKLFGAVYANAGSREKLEKAARNAGIPVAFEAGKEGENFFNAATLAEYSMKALRDARQEMFKAQIEQLKQDEAAAA